MSRRSEKQLMRQALELTERNLSWFINSRTAVGLGDQQVVTKALLGWRCSVRRALGHWPATAQQDWQEWRGADESPLPEYTPVEVRFRGGGDEQGYAAWFNPLWNHDRLAAKPADDIIAYRVRTA